MPLVFSIGLRLESLGQPFRAALETAARIGVLGVQFDAVGELSPDQLSTTGIRQLRHLIGLRGLKVAAIGAPTRRGFDTLERIEGRIDYVKKTLRLAHQLSASCVLHQGGIIPAERNSASAHFFDALQRLGDEADRVGARLALRTGWDPVERLTELLTEIGRYGLAIDFDPASMLARGHSPYAAIAALRDRLVCVHVKDIVRTGTTVAGFREAPLGDGEVRWPELIASLRDHDYQGDLILERESATDAEAELSRSVRTLVGW